MKLSQETISVLKHFSNISPQMKIHQGNEQSIKNASVCLAYVTVDEAFPQDFIVYDLGEFISMISMFKDPELEFHEKYVIIKSGTQEIKYFNTEESFVKNSIAKDVLKNVPDFEVEFDLPKSTIESIMKGSGVLNSKLIEFTFDGKNVTGVVSANEESVTANTFKIKIGELQSDVTGKVAFNVENWKIPNNDYRVSLSSKGLCKLESKDGKSLFYIAINKKHSEFNLG